MILFIQTFICEDVRHTALKRMEDAVRSDRNHRAVICSPFLQSSRRCSCVELKFVSMIYNNNGFAWGHATTTARQASGRELCAIRKKVSMPCHLNYSTGHTLFRRLFECSSKPSPLTSTCKSRRQSRYDFVLTALRT